MKILRSLGAMWMKLAGIMNRISTTVIYTIIFFTIIPVFVITHKRSGKKNKVRTHWIRKNELYNKAFFESMA